MKKIKRIGAVMIYANQPERLAQWYDKHLGIETSYYEKDAFYQGEVPDETTNGSIHFGIFQAEQKLDENHHAIMINYQTDDLDNLVEQLKAAGIEIEKTLNEDYGRFVYIRDPEGNAVELYEEATDPEKNN